MWGYIHQTLINRRKNLISLSYEVRTDWSVHDCGCREGGVLKIVRIHHLQRTSITISTLSDDGGLGSVSSPLKIIVISNCNFPSTHKEFTAGVNHCGFAVKPQQRDTHNPITCSSITGRQELNSSTQAGRQLFRTRLAPQSQLLQLFLTFRLQFIHFTANKSFYLHFNHLV